MDNLKFLIKKSGSFLIDLLFPAFCFGCRKEGSYLCEDCRATLDICESDYCLCAINPIKLPARRNSGKCERCRDKHLSGLFFALPYKEKPLTKKIIKQFKYDPYVRGLAKPLAEILSEHFLLAGTDWQDMNKDAVLVPVPLSRSRIRYRGYNQSEELAKELSKVLNIPLVPDNLIKIKSTPAQAGLSGKERSQNLKNAFAIKNPSEIAEKKILLVDDVYTTGSTMEECSAVLKRSGAGEVWGIAIAREN